LREARMELWMIASVVGVLIVLFVVVMVTAQVSD
jgi:hypothetical protein